MCFSLLIHSIQCQSQELPPLNINTKPERLGCISCNMAQCVYVLEFIQTMSCTLIIDFQHLKYIYLVIPYTLKGVLSKNLQKPYICGRGGITVGVTVHTMLTHLVQLIQNFNPWCKPLVRGNR